MVQNQAFKNCLMAVLECGNCLNNRKIKADATVKGGVRLFFWSEKSKPTAVFCVPIAATRKIFLARELNW